MCSQSYTPATRDRGGQLGRSDWTTYVDQSHTTTSSTSAISGNSRATCEHREGVKLFLFTWTVISCYFRSLMFWKRVAV